MSQEPPNEPKKEPSKPQDSGSVSRLLWSMADTTWRMFTPPALIVPGGIFFDVKLHTKPWLTILSAIIGLVLSALLVRRQLREDK